MNFGLLSLLYTCMHLNRVGLPACVAGELLAARLRNPRSSHCSSPSTDALKTQSGVHVLILLEVCLAVTTATILFHDPTIELEKAHLFPYPPLSCTRHDLEYILLKKQERVQFTMLAQWNCSGGR